MSPATIVLMRHAEKPRGRGDPYLTLAGRRRAQRLAAFIPKLMGRPQFIFAASSAHSQRPMQTVEPLSRRTGVPIDSAFAANQYAALAKRIVGSRKYANSRLVICWRHTNLPQLAKALGAQRGDYPGRWDSKVFDLLLRFDYRRTQPPVVTSIKEPF